MKPALESPAWLRRLRLAASILVCWVGATVGFTPEAHSGDTKSQNAFAWSPVLPADLRRVALLPLTCEAKSLDDAEGRDALEPILQQELLKARRFEVLSIAPDPLQKHTGQPSWRQEETLPADLFEWLKTASGCDAVLFCHLTAFQPYPSLLIGWRMRLVDLRTQTTLWAVDQVFDAGQMKPEGGKPPWTAWLGLDSGTGRSEEWALRNSPRRFGQYALARVFSTLPEP